VSSTYYTLCLSHDPAIEYRPHRSAEEALAEIAAGGISEHPHCDLVVLRMSGGPSELVCPPSREHRPDACLAHSDPVWIDADVLTCLAAVRRSTDPEILAAADATRLFRHWPRQRLHRLRSWLDFPPLDDPDEKAERP
jgi:hypothetical protein